MRFLLRWTFRTLAAALWLVVVWLLIETAAMSLRVLEVRNNPLLAAYTAIGLPARPVEDPRSLLFPAEPESVLYPADTGNDPCAALPIPSLDVSRVELREQYRRDFATMSSDARDAAVRLGSEIAIVLDRDGRFIEAIGDMAAATLAQVTFGVWGNSILRFLVPDNFHSELDAAVERAREGNASSRLNLPFDDDSGESGRMVYEVFPAGTREDEAVVVFEENDPAALFIASDKVSSESRWEIPYFRFKADYDGGPDAFFQTNSLGWRDAPVQIPKPEGTFRIVCIGSSTTEEGPSNDTTYPNLLESLLRQEYPDRNIEVVNAGVSGMSSANHLNRVEDYLLLEPDLVIIYEGANDLIRIAKSPFRMLSGEPPWKFLAQQSPALWQWFPALTLPDPAEFQRKLQDGLVRNLEILAARLRCQGADVAFASFAYPDPARIPEDEAQLFDRIARGQTNLTLNAYRAHMQGVNAMIRAMAERSGYLYLPLAERLSGGADIFWDICHMYPAATEAKAIAVAEALAPWLSARPERKDAAIELNRVPGVY